MLRRSSQFLHHRHLQTFINANLSTKLASFSPNFPNSNSPHHNSNLINHASREIPVLGHDTKFKEYGALLNGCVNQKHVGGVHTLHAQMIKTRYLRHMYLGGRLIVLYLKCGSLDDARKVFDDMPERNVVSWTAMISGYTKSGLCSEALHLFVQMLRSGLAALEYGRQVHSHLLRSQLSFYVIIQNSLIDMYSKCGNLVYARRIFDKMDERTVSSWNVMLGGYSKHGNGEAVVELYERMNEEKKVNADSTTLLTVLSGCSHGGMEQKGLDVFNEMASNTGFDLGIEHYGCIVDLLGRGGQLEKALQFINEMPLQPNAAIWGSLLGACRAHKNFRVGKVAGDRLLETEPENGGNYVMLCNLYASDGRWHEVRKVRELMKEKAVKKEAGKSWIAIGQIHRTFYAGDRPENEDVLCKVLELSDRIKGVGYSPDLNSVLHDVDNEQKERILLGHSEKLALAFGVMNVSEAKPIRIMKNLRICVDCHSFAKFVSLAYSRELLIRDKSRFHHIVNGICSCGDYW